MFPNILILVSTLTSCVNPLSLKQALNILDGSFTKDIIHRGLCDLFIIEYNPLPYYGANRGIYASTESNFKKFGTVFLQTHCMIIVAGGDRIDKENLLTIGKDIQMKNPVALLLRNMGRNKIKELRKLDVTLPVLIMSSDENGKHTL